MSLQPQLTAYFIIYLQKLYLPVELPHINILTLDVYVRNVQCDVRNAKCYIITSCVMHLQFRFWSSTDC